MLFQLVGAAHAGVSARYEITTDILVLIAFTYCAAARASPMMPRYHRDFAKAHRAMARNRCGIYASISPAYHEKLKCRRCSYLSPYNDAQPENASSADMSSTHQDALTSMLTEAPAMAHFQLPRISRHWRTPRAVPRARRPIRLT